MVSTAAPVSPRHSKNGNDLSSVSSSNCLAFCCRQTTGNGGTPGETQSHPDPRFFREREGVWHRQGQVQPVKVSHQFIQHCAFCKKNWDTGKTKFLLQTSMLFLSVSISRALDCRHLQWLWWQGRVSRCPLLVPLSVCMETGGSSTSSCEWEKISSSMHSDVLCDIFAAAVTSLSWQKGQRLFWPGCEGSQYLCHHCRGQGCDRPSHGQQRRLCRQRRQRQSQIPRRGQVKEARRALRLKPCFRPWRAAFPSDHCVCFLLQLAVQSLLKIH